METQERKKWLGASIEARHRYMANELSIPHPEFVRAANEIKRRMRRCENENTGAGLLLLAPSGAGKTHLCKTLKARWPGTDSETLTTVPVVRFKVPSKPTERSMAQALLKEMGDPDWKRGTALELSERIEHLVPIVGTKLILIDNVHDIPDRRGETGIRHIGNWIRTLIDECPALVVLLGTPAALGIVQANDQLKRRTTKQLRMDYFYIDTPPHFQRFKKFMGKLFDALPLADRSELSDDLAREIHDATFGILDFIMELHVEALGCAFGAGRESLTRDDFALAFTIVHKDGLIGQINPFRAGSARRPLTKPGELFFEWFDSSNPPLRPLQNEGANAI